MAEGNEAWPGYPRSSTDPGRHIATNRLRQAVTAVIVAGIVLRIVVSSAMWLDEAQTVAISRLPFTDLAGALRHDGAPPLYYVLFHLWMMVAGHSTLAVRALPALFGVAALPAMWRLGRRIGGPETAWTATLLLASSPFAVRYSSENRMYSLIVLLSLLGAISILDALERPTPNAGLKVAGLVALALYTHYWTIFLVLGTVVVLASRWWKRPASRAGTAVALKGVGGGVLLFVPWLPVFVWQSAHTSTPWSVPPSFAAMASAVGGYSGGDTSAGWALGLVLFALVVLGVFGRPGRDHIIIELRPQPRARGLTAIVFVTAAVALVGTLTSQSAIAPRYSSIIFGFWLILAALGVQTIPEQRIRRGVVAALVAFGLVGSVMIDRQPRAQAPQVAAALRENAHVGDVVAYCPDQLGPAVSRLLPNDITQYTFPRWAAPQRVDWIDYKARNSGQSTTAFAADLDALAQGHTLWLVWSDAYRGTIGPCTRLKEMLGTLRGAPSAVVRSSSRFYENESLLAYT